MCVLDDISMDIFTEEPHKLSQLECHDTCRFPKSNVGPPSKGVSCSVSVYMQCWPVKMNLYKLGKILENCEPCSYVVTLLYGYLI